MSAAPLFRLATPGDLAAVETLLGRSYPALLKADYPPSVLVTAVPRIVHAQPALLASGSYWLAEEGGTVIAAGGWTATAPGTGPGSGGNAYTGHVRHVATDPAHLRRGLARGLLERAIAQAQGQGLRRLNCLSTRTAVPFYAALGFRTLGPTDVPLGPGIVFPAVAMVLDLPAPG
ncbi:MAG: GNAT family N-acetyltransferase [Roseivivax sp.]|nr:GNAT family N-acetyltransferase [Roseivivax sp.]